MTGDLVQGRGPTRFGEIWAGIQFSLGRFRTFHWLRGPLDGRYFGGGPVMPGFSKRRINSP